MIDDSLLRRHLLNPKVKVGCQLPCMIFNKSSKKEFISDLVAYDGCLLAKTDGDRGGFLARSKS